MSWAQTAAAFSIGLLGSGHCLAMCGSLVAGHAMVRAQHGGHVGGAISVPLHDLAAPRAPELGHVLLLNAGRICGYMILAAALSAVGTVLITPLAADMLRSVGAGVMILIGLHLGGWSRSVLGIERAALRVFSYARRASSCIGPRGSMRHSVLSGLLWSGMPCAMVHSTILWAATSAEPAGTLAMMLAFGLGTLPAMLVVGVASRELQQLLRRIRPLGAALLIVFGLLSIPWIQQSILAYAPSSAHSHHHMAE
ncbi:MAG: sulfite exporter TauE/SafE family protein [Pseudomonadota bacterium]|nr:sulfite exporter TauE/SafE family protein [Pseudomonadota bacterium]